jgi:hypothetical protein
MCGYQHRYGPATPTPLHNRRAWRFLPLCLYEVHSHVRHTYLYFERYHRMARNDCSPSGPKSIGFGYVLVGSKNSREKELM